MPPRARRRGIIDSTLMAFPTKLRWLAAAVSATCAAACGASSSAIYEGDVRFEHCMALDTRSEVKPTIRRACWEEWQRFYTFGQTRDRVEYARARIKNLSGASDFEDWTPAETGKILAVPEPTSALAPPPMMLAPDAGAPRPVPPPVASAAPDGGVPTAEGCVGECDEALAYCRAECKDASCERDCAGKYKRCAKRCD
jgi:hypothetical protein